MDNAGRGSRENGASAWVKGEATATPLLIDGKPVKLLIYRCRTG